MLNGAYRLPVIGFDTATVVGSPGAWYPPAYPLGGWGYLLRDYLKNDFDVATCPDGWYTKDDFLQPWDGGSFKRLYSEKVPFVWLVDRELPTAAANGKRSADLKADVARVASDQPMLLITADYILWAGIGNGFVI